MKITSYKSLSSYPAEKLSEIFLKQSKAPYEMLDFAETQHFIQLANLKLSHDPSFSSLHQRLDAEQDIQDVLLLLNQNDYICAGTNPPKGKQGIYHFCLIEKLPEGSFGVIFRASDIIHREFSQHGDWLLDGFYRYLLPNRMHLLHLSKLDERRFDRTIRAAIQDTLSQFKFTQASR